MHIRIEEPPDHTAVYAINALAFETPAEANLVEALREKVDPIISLVAVEDEVVLGHIMFSPVTLSGHASLKIMGLGPMAVLPEQQNKGIGSTLVRSGLERCKELGFGAVVVLGHPWFYPRFGFIPSVCFSIRSEYDAPTDAFMVLEIYPGYLRGAQGIARYHPAFNDV